METAAKQNPLLKVGRTTDVKELGKSIFSSYVKEGLSEVVVRAIGAAAINQAVKGIVIARGNLSPKGVSILTEMSFVDVQDSSGTITAIAFRLIFTSNNQG